MQNFWRMLWKKKQGNPLACFSNCRQHYRAHLLFAKNKIFTCQAQGFR